MSALTEDTKKLAEDFSHGKKLGEKSTALLISIIVQMAIQIDYLKAITDRRA